MSLPRLSRALKVAAASAVAAVSLVACSSSDSDAGSGSDAGSDSSGAADSYAIGINQLVQHPALDSATEGFKEAFEEAGVEVEWDEQNANGEQPIALTIAQQFGSSDLDLVLAVATPAAQATVQNVTDIPVLFTAVTDPVEADLVDSMEAPGANVTGTSDAAPVDQQLDLLMQLVPGAESIGIVYASGEINSQIQVDEVIDAAGALGIEVTTQTVTNVTEIPQAAEAIGDVDAFYVPTDNMVVSGISSLIQVAETKEIPVIAAEAGTVEGGAVATIGIDYKELGRQTGEMALRILRDGEDPAAMAVETATEFTYVVNEEAAEAQGVTVPQEILDKAERV